MKRKLKHCRSTIPTMSTKPTITSHLHLLNTTYDVGNPSTGWQQARKWGGVKPVIVYFNLLFLISVTYRMHFF